MTMVHTKLTRLAMSAALAAVLAGCSAGYGGVDAAPVAPATLAEVTMTQPPARDPSELQVLFWNDDQRTARFRDMESWFAGLEVPAASTTRVLQEGAPLSPEIQADLRTWPWCAGPLDQFFRREKLYLDPAWRRVGRWVHYQP
jgi:hypothetical protein